MTTAKAAGHGASIDAAVRLSCDFCHALTSEGWDRPPHLAVITETKTRLALTSVPLATGLWEMAEHPTRVLDALTDQLAAEEPVIAALIPGLDGPDATWRGYSFAVEAWAFPMEHPHECSMDDCPYLAWVGSIADHPEAVEQRTVLTWTMDRAPVWVQQDRGAEPLALVISEEMGDRLVGAVPAALQRLVDATVCYLSTQH